MSEEIAIQLRGVGKMYKTFASRTDNLLDALGLAPFIPWHHVRHSEFWALREIDLILGRGRRIGIIGRNGAGKSTLLKLITGNLNPTEGTLQVIGRVHALIDTGAGFHPDFSGYENIRAALTYQGLSQREIAEAESDIEEFTELGEFLNRPFKTYSAGMQARLAFATATVIKPEILIIDEVLGAGDAYFLGKSNERMRQLIYGGASILLVSHSLEQITMLCEEAIWIDRGRIVKKGPSLEVVKAYQQFVQVLEDRRLKAKNRKVHSASYDSSQYDSFSDTLLVHLDIEGEAAGSCDVAEIRLMASEEIEAELLVGHAQDVEPSHGSFVVLEGSHWSEPRVRDDTLFRTLVCNSSGAPARGTAAFNLYSLRPDVDYALVVRYRCRGANVSAQVWKNGELVRSEPIVSESDLWQSRRMPLGPLARGGEDRSDENGARVTTGLEQGLGDAPDQAKAPRTVLSRWPGEGSLLIDTVVLLGADGQERAVYHAGDDMSVSVTLKATRDGEFNVIPTAVLYRLDGLLITRHIGPAETLRFRTGETRTALLQLGPLNLGNGHYVFSIAIYRQLDVHNLETPVCYDLVDRSYEFQVTGVPPLRDGVFQHSGTWSMGPMAPAPSRARAIGG